MINLEELEKKYAELCKEIQALKENKLQCHIYCKSKSTGLIVKFDDLTSGIVVKQDSRDYVGYKSTTWVLHTNTELVIEIVVLNTITTYNLKETGMIGC